MSLNAANPFVNATVSASAGSGKTWLLITRIIRLLLEGADAGNILALTFTRKAAGEMQIRLNQRLHEMATASDENLVSLLKQAGCKTDTTTLQTARGLYEKLLHNLYPVRLQTFHSFCQDILSKFPVEADIPPGFDLLEDTGLLEQQAWQALFVEATQSPTGKLAQYLEILMDSCNGVANTRMALNNFISHRSDWWAFSNNQPQPLHFANEQLRACLQIQFPCNPVDNFFSSIENEELKIFANLLREHPTATNLKHAQTIDETLLTSADHNQCFERLQPAFLTRNGEALKRKDGKTLQTKLGADNAARFLRLHYLIAEKMILTIDYLRRLETLEVNQAWCYTGQYLLTVFQRFKREQRLLDFTDLEWKCFQLISHADNAEWIQYKIDQRIDHILIDEFQDTNPTQWHLLAPILEEIAASDKTRWRSVFLVGDEKQSIYSFRRANPKLQAQASTWLAENLNAKVTPLDASRRSSQAIINCVNRVFLQQEVKKIMPGFTEHKTWLEKLPGKVCLTELFQQADEEQGDKKQDNLKNNLENDEQLPVFRNPLKNPRTDESINSHHDEATTIAKQIQQLLDEPAKITENDTVRTIEYGDIMILMRNRLHIETYENCLRQHNIPFIGSKRGGLLENLEVQDLIKLLETLLTPFNNLSLAQVLKSPIFSASDDDLISLATGNQQDTTSPHWYERLLLLVDEKDCTEPLQRAAKLLPRWRELANHLPIHDCLDRIFSEANILQRYAAADENNKNRVVANCQRLLELSLENDSGRYPGISHFLQYLKNTQQYSQNPLDEPLVKNKQSRVRLLTIHASKGLEAPVVFIADCNSAASSKSAYSTYVNWPENSAKPVNFMLQLGKRNTDSITAQLQQKKIAEQKREDLNLLYVALTRAREQLFISGIESRRNSSGWYSLLHQALDGFALPGSTANNKNCLTHQFMSYASVPVSTENLPRETAKQKKPVNVDPRLQRPVAMAENRFFILAPAKLAADKPAPDETGQKPFVETGSESDNDIDVKLRGTVVHRAIELLSNNTDRNNTDKASTPEQILVQLAADFRYPADSELIQQCLHEAEAIHGNPDFAEIFRPTLSSACYNELPILYYQGEQAVYGLIDRVIRTETEIHIIDYKSHRVSPNDNLAAYAEQFRPQMDYYQQGLKKIWPQCDYKTGILFTYAVSLIWL